MDSTKRRNQREPRGEIIRRLRIQNKKLLEQVSFLREKAKKEKVENGQILGKMNQLVKLNNALSDALGSCNRCWGEDSDCTFCGGSGSSGWRNVNKRQYNIYVLPALERLYRLSAKLKSSHLSR